MVIILGDKIYLIEFPSNDFKEPHTLNARDFHGKIALACAVRMDHLEVVAMLFESGAEPSIADCREYSSSTGQCVWPARRQSRPSSKLWESSRGT